MDSQRSRPPCGHFAQTDPMHDVLIGPIGTRSGARFAAFPTRKRAQFS
jgi:hypothetical protein